MKRLRAIVDDLRDVTPTVLEVVLRPDHRGTFPTFKPGQYATLSFPQHPTLKGERSFSIASSPMDLDTLRFGIRIGGRYTSGLRTLRRGDLAMVAGPFGAFTFDPARDRSAVFIAGGIGITPFLSMVRGATDLRLTNDLTLLYSVRSLSDLPYGKELYEIERANPNVRVTYAISDGNVLGVKGRVVPGRITGEVISAALGPSLWGRSYFLCGPSSFMSAMTRLLQAGGLPKKAIRTERFGVGSSAIIEGGTPIPKFVLAGWGATAAIVLIGLGGIEQEKREASREQERATNTLRNESVNSNVNTSIPVLPVNTGGAGVSGTVTNTAVAPTAGTNANTTPTPATVNTGGTPIKNTPPPVKKVTPPVAQPVTPRVTPRTTVS